MLSKNDVLAALSQKGGLEVLQETSSSTQLRIVGRSAPEKWAMFSTMVHNLLAAADKPGSGWSCDVSKQYLARDGKLRYIWRVIFQAEDLASKYTQIVSTIQSTPRPAVVELESITLPGYAPGTVRGGVNERGKGVSSSGSAPMAVTRRR